MLFEFNDAILRELNRLIIKSRGQNIRVIILLVPRDIRRAEKAPRVKSPVEKFLFPTFANIFGKKDKTKRETIDDAVKNKPIKFPLK